MHIQKYGLYDLNYGTSYFIDFTFKGDALYPLTSLLKEIYPYNSALWYKNFIQKSEAFSTIGLFQNAEVIFDEKNNLIYIAQAEEDDYRFRMKNTTKSMVLELCHDGTLIYNTITKDNFIHLVSSWAQLLYQQSPFALLYHNNKNWYDVLAFDTQEAMEQFVTNHKKNNKKSLSIIHLKTRE